MGILDNFEAYLEFEDFDLELAVQDPHKTVD
jgi:uncharacterized protein YjbK